MSGFAATFGEADRAGAEAMLQKMAHRGRERIGAWEGERCALAQNLLAADGVPAGTPLPVARDGVRIAYDGQVIRPAAEGETQEERLLGLYAEHGAGMFESVGDAVFAFVISDGQRLLAARDLLGIKTLFYGRRNGTLCFASELKGLAALTDDVNEFPPGHYMTESGELQPFATLPAAPPARTEEPLETIGAEVRRLIDRNVRATVDFSAPTAGLLSGGMDSSVINLIASRILREKEGQSARLKTFAIGLEDSSDVQNARILAEHIGSDHEELIVDLDEILEVLPEVIYMLENFDPSLVRSSVSNYLISRHAKDEGYRVLLSGEGGDEIFCGYAYLKEYPLEEMFAKQMECLRFLHNNASLRLDRMNACHGVKVVAPLVSADLLTYAMTLPPELKQKPDGDGRIEKYIFRKAFEKDLPEAITWRLKQEFSQGSGSAGKMPAYFESYLSDEEFAEVQAAHPVVRSKEEAYYFRLFTEHFGEGKAVETVGQWIRL